MKTDGRRKNQPMKKQKRKLGNDIDQHKRLEKDKNKKAKLWIREMGTSVQNTAHHSLPFLIWKSILVNQGRRHLSLIKFFIIFSLYQTTIKTILSFSFLYIYIYIYIYTLPKIHPKGPLVKCCLILKIMYSIFIFIFVYSFSESKYTIKDPFSHSVIIWHLFPIFFFSH